MDYKDTLNLPKTEFPMKANLPKREPEMLSNWDSAKLYEKMIERTKDKTPFVFHDGPPYANGHLHLGTMLNKILKDVVVKYRNMSGFNCTFVPGWDCHGLPIELAVDKKLKSKKRDMTAAEIRKECRKHAEKFVGIQRDEFKRLGCLGRWNDPYLTMSTIYESTIAREFGRFVENKSVYKAKKPIFWCPSCMTALAEAEVEYADHASPSIYVKFKLIDDSDFRSRWNLKDQPISLVIWTTTPWTIPANLAIALHPDLPYVAVEVDGEVWILAEGLMDIVMKAVGKSYYKVVGKLSAKELEHKHAKHPIIDRKSLIILGEHVTLEAGTGAVHTAPGHGQDDYEVGLKYGLDILAPVDHAGRFTKECEIDWLVGLKVGAANQPIVEHLEKNGSLIKTSTISHSYPHCWRCKKPIIFRSTEQWFISMKQNELRKNALEAISKVNWIPHWGENRIRGMLEVRPDWCVSRQRLWGVPIPAVVCKECGSSEITPEIANKAADIFEKESSDAWYIRPVEDFLPNNFKCSECGGTKFGAERDILDVWFDSGVSYSVALEKMQGIDVQADLYLEGSDQHRGWFHTSLLTSVGTRARAPYKNVLTHGFVVDGKGKKLSKSLGNYTPPDQVLDKYGAEIIRIWAASEDYRDDIRFSDEIIQRTVESYRKIRNTFKFMLGNLFDFDPDKNLVPVEKLNELDRYALYKLSRTIDRIKKAFEDYEFHMVYHTLIRLVTVDLSSFYLDILKDSLYADLANGEKRRSAQTAIWHIVDNMCRFIAPIYSFTAEDVWNFMPKKVNAAQSVFLTDFPETILPKDVKFEEKWEKFRKFRSEATKALEEARAAKLIGNSLEAKLIIETSEDEKNFLESFDNLPDLLITSEVAFEKVSANAKTEEGSSYKFEVKKTSGIKCPRCWKYTSIKENEICERCKEVVGEK